MNIRNFLIKFLTAGVNVHDSTRKYLHCIVCYFKDIINA